MTFGPNHYVPVLKVKRGEKAALLSIAPGLRGGITPLLEIVERNHEKSESVDAHLNTAFAGLLESVRPYSRFFLDVREIARDGSRAAIAAFRRATQEGMNFTPVTGVSRSSDVEAAMGHRGNGIAIRLTRPEMESRRLTTDLLEFMSRHSLVPRDVDLILDLGDVCELIPEGIKSLTQRCLTAVPIHREWRTFTLSASAFPQSMGGIERQDHSMIERAEWISWRNGMHARRLSLTRLPTFSDCGIQHPKGVEGFDFRVMPVSAAIRYTRPEHWLLIKGESTRITPPGEQFPQLAKKLVYGALRAHFSGPDHCDGCRKMKAAADGAPKLGSAEVWRRLGTVHHISMVMDGLASLTWP